MAVMQAGADTGGVFASFSRMLQTTTALVLPAHMHPRHNPWRSFSGLAQDAITRAIGAGPTVRASARREIYAPKSAMEWVSEAARRLSGLLAGDIKPRTPAEARKILDDAKVTVRRETVARNRTSVVVVDELTKISVPASRISPRLETSIYDMLGRDVKADVRFATERVTARYYLDALRQGGLLRPSGSGDESSFRDWLDLQIVVSGIRVSDAARQRGMALGYTVVETTAADGRRSRAGYIGLQVDRCDRKPDKTWQALREKADHLGIPLPGAAGTVDDAVKKALASYFVFDPAMTPNTPVLLRDGHLVPAASVNPSLDVNKLETSFLFGAERRKRLGDLSLRNATTSDELRLATRAVTEAERDRTMVKFRVAMASIAGVAGLREAHDDKVVDIDVLRAAKAQKIAREAAAAAEPIVGFDTPIDSYDPAAVLIRYDERGHPTAYLQRRKGIDDPFKFGNKAEIPLVGVNRLVDLQPGTYPVEDMMGMPDGTIEVTQDRRVRRHALSRPAEAAAEPSYGPEAPAKAFQV